ncbi:MAG: hypothetical protein E7454_05815 [Ruminococcaceae bacterium]|nr:hypothetical protein [Oscillospiraceae bacterium]
MARALVTEEQRNSIELQDLSPVLREVATGKQNWIYTYCDRAPIGEVMYQDFIHYNQVAMGQQDTFMFSAELRKEGILSLTQAFQVVAMTLENFKLEQSEQYGEEAKSRVIRMLDKIMNMVEPREGVYEFDASPYLEGTEHFKNANSEYAYIDSMTWVVSSLLSAFRLHINDICPLDQERMDRAVRIYQYCINFLIKSFIDGGENISKFTSGWNYTKKCSVPSGYFTFAVSEVMIDILSTFNNVIRSADIDLVQQEIDDRLKAVASADEIAAKKQQVAMNYAQEDQHIHSDTPVYVREKQLFALLNENKAVYDRQSLYRQLEAAVKKAANNLWALTKNHLSDSFFASDMKTRVPEDVIEQSVQSDALFNTIFVINTLVNAGLDEDMEDEINYYTLNGSQEYEDALAEYDNIRDTLRISYDNVYQFYLKLEKKKKSYKVNEYNLSFDEEFKGLEDQVKDLRKARIRVFSLMPLLVKTKTTLGEFVIRYPQYDMQLYLENILNFRCVRTKYGMADDYYWTWERDGYSSSSNYYFVSALNDFYSYYEEYEQAVSQNAVENKDARENVQRAYLEELEQSDGIIGKLRAEQQKKEHEIQDLQEQLKTLEAQHAVLREAYDNDPLRKAMTDMICAVVREQILSVSSIGGLLTGLSEQLTASAKEKVARKAEDMSNAGWYKASVEAADPDVQAFEEGLRKFGVALLSERLMEMLLADRRNQESAEAAYTETAESATRDIDQAIRLFVSPYTKGVPSDYVRTEGYKGLPAIIQNENMKNKKQNN